MQQKTESTGLNVVLDPVLKRANYLRQQKAESGDTLASESDSAGADGKNKTTNNKKYKRNGN